MRGIKIKICGLTRKEDVLALNGLGIDFAGFIFVPGTPRCLDIARAARLTRLVPPGVRRVGVFLDQRPESVRRIAGACGLDLLQFHGSESPQYCGQFGLPYFKTIRVLGPIETDRLAAYRPEAFLFDTYSPREAGGTGKTFDWSLAREAAEGGLKFILAGGLNPENVARAIGEARPWGVDVSSGVESAPGIKDPAKLKTFVRAAREHTQ
ncbi:MAG: phosphoribosylanthranilate isomerase [Candidatus Erginobacter occultus]|nr:phosphoribosylanthranilate isomerase [Candidatus Erginobacter occultus]